MVADPTPERLDPMDVVWGVNAVADGDLEPEVFRGLIDAISPTLAERLWSDIAATLTVYDEHVAPERRGEWRYRLAALSGYEGAPMPDPVGAVELDIPGDCDVCNGWHPDNECPGVAAKPWVLALDVLGLIQEETARWEWPEIPEGWRLCQNQTFTSDWRLWCTATNAPKDKPPFDYDSEIVWAKRIVRHRWVTPWSQGDADGRQRPLTRAKSGPPYEDCGFCQQGVIYGGTDREADCPYCGGSGISSGVCVGMADGICTRYLDGANWCADGCQEATDG